ncbi:hypothetical protein EV363DRAFT_1194013 [Boletus edulis]|nr:hypothetical protein EV363DRAFT_1194013 [Boletus edulis]
MELPCLAFKLGRLSATRSPSGHVFRARTTALGIVEIRSEEDLSQYSTLHLVHPWIDFLLEQQPVGNTIETIPEENTDNQSSLIGELPSSLSFSNIISTAPQTRMAQLVTRLGATFGGRTISRRRDTSLFHPPSDTASLRPPSTLAQSDKEMLALRAIARLRQPFGALLLRPDLDNVAASRRVATENLITVQVEEITPTILDKLLRSVGVLHVL